MICRIPQQRRRSRKRIVLSRSEAVRPCRGQFLIRLHAGGGQPAQASDQKDAGDKKDNSDKKKNAAGDESKPADRPENEKK